MKHLTENEQLIIDTLLEYPNINNTDLAMAVYMSPSALNKAFKALGAKFDIDGKGRRRRVELISSTSFKAQN